MKKLFILFFLLVPFILQAQSDNVRMKVNHSDNTITFWWGTQQLTVPGSSLPSYPIYYVSNSGSDSNDGLTPATAWQTIAKVNAITFTPGSKINFKRGDEWREQLTISQSGTTDNRITFTAYGTGAKPKFNAANITTGWGDKYNNINVNIWGTVDPSASAGFSMVVINNVLYTQVATLAELTTANTYWIKTAADSIYVYKTADPDLVTCELSARDYGITSTNNNYITISYLDVRNAGKFGIALEGNTGGVLEGYCVIDSVNAYRNRLTGIELMANNTTSYYTHNTVTNCVVTYNGNGIVLWEHIDNSTISYCYSANSIHNYAVAGTYSDGSGFQTYISDNTIIEYCESHGDSSPIFLDPYDATHADLLPIMQTARYNKIYDNQNFDGGIVAAAPDAGGKTYVYYNLVVNCGYGTYERSPIHVSGSGTGDVYIYNNTIYVAVDAVKNVKGTIYVQYGITNRFIKNNISHYTPNDSYANLTSLNSADLTSNYNQWYRNYAGGNLFWIIASGYTTLAAWTAAFGEDANSNIADPLFTTNGSNFNLQAGSPCVNTGTVISAIPQIDILGHPIIGLPDKGCYERQ